MTVFYTLASALTLIVLVWLMRPLLRPQSAPEVSSQQLNVAIYREQLEALDADLARGAISAQEHEMGRDEVQLRMLDDVQDATAPKPAAHQVSKATAVVVSLLVVLGAGGMYRWLGNPGSINPVSAQQAQQQQVIQMVETLAQRLQANPDNPRGWAMLARSYKVMGRLDDAMQAYGKTGKLLETDPDLMADYADLLAVRAGDSLDGEPIALVRKALAIDPKHPMSLMLIAAQSYREGKFAQAIGYWETLLSALDPQSADAEQIMAYIADAREKNGVPPPRAQTAMPTGQPDSAQIQQMVERLAARLKTNPDDVQGWTMLARSYRVLGRVQDAEEAERKAKALGAR